MFKPRASTKGRGSMRLVVGVLVKVQVRAGRCASSLFLALLFVVVAHQFSSHLAMRIAAANLHLRIVFASNIQIID